MLSSQNSNQQSSTTDSIHAPNIVVAQEPQATRYSKEDTEQVLTSLPDSLLFLFAQRLLALVALILLSPPLLLIALAIRLQGGGPAFYLQTRVGRGEKFFTIYKFRTMRTDAEDQGPFICKDYKDPRITSLGKLLRKSKLDELPQLWNIFRGEMAFVGPRPERPHFHAQFSAIPHWRERTRVRPGLTGMAQASKWISHDPKEKLQADRVYLEKRSLALDILLVFYTLYPKARPKDLYGVPLN